MSLIGSAIKREWRPGRISSQDHGDRLFLKRIVYARRPRQFAVADWTTHLGRRQSLHDVPADGQTIGRDEPILTLITEVDRAAAEPLDCYKTLLRQMC
jgi:predicted ATP-grasp superfamily ATP-dependent carboligase